mgnify:CR=1 FL=1
MEHDKIQIEFYDDVYLKINCERGMAKELSEFFTFKVPYKNKIWDGQIRLFNLYKQTIYRGLYDYIIQFAKDRNYKITVDSDKEKYNSVSFDDVKSYLTNNLKIPYNPHDHQIEAIKTSINNFKEYSDKTDWDVEKYCHTIFAGQDKDTDKKVVISTWQSIYKMNQKYFDHYHVVFGDECHLFKAKSLTNIMTKLINCPYRIGTTGTLDDSLTHKLVIEGLFGRVQNITTTKELMEKNLLSHLNIDCITLKYRLEEINEIKRAKYDEEIKWILNNKKRNAFLVDLSCRVKGNTLILFNYVKDHGIPLFESIQNSCGDKRVFLIHGKTEVQQREEIRNILEKEKNAILVASYGTCSTGINIKNINNIVFASPSRSVVRVLQSIGRGLRRTETKDKVKLYDISDDLRFKKYVNHTYRHLQERIKIYQREKFEYSSVSIKI